MTLMIMNSDYDFKAKNMLISATQFKNIQTELNKLLDNGN